MKDRGEQHYNDYAANYFILFVLALIAIPSTYIFVKNRLFPKKDAAARCGCRDCQQKANSSQTKTRKGPSIGSIFKGILLVILWGMIVTVVINSTNAEQPETSYFDPYAILGLETGAPMDVVKKTYKILSLKHHPDKAADPNDPAVQDKYINIVKAYESLTDDAVREKWEKYGNPDGPQAMSVGIALPSWLVKKDNTAVVLSVYLALLVIGLPSAVGIWWRKWRRFDNSSKVMNSTMGLYYHTMEPISRLKSLIEVLSASEEFQRVPARDIDEKLEKVTRSIPDNHSLKKKPRFTAQYAVKTHLLLYWQLCRMQSELKASHRADLAYILSRVRSLIGGIITIGTAKGFYNPIIEGVQLLQSLTQSAWKEQPLLQLPHFGQYSSGNLNNRKLKVTDIQSFVALPEDAKKEFYTKEEFKPEQIQDIEDVLNFLPTKVACEYTVGVEGEDPDTIVCGAIVTFYFTVTRNPTDPAAYNTFVAKKKIIEPDNPSAIKKKTALDALRPKRIVHAPHFAASGEPREECWWMVIGDLRTSTTTGGLAGIHKIGTLEGDTPVDGKIKFMAPAQEGNYTFVVHLMCDGYIGFDKKAEFKIKVMRDQAAEKEKAALESKLKAKKEKMALERKQKSVINNNKMNNKNNSNKNNEIEEIEEDEDDSDSYYSDSDSDDDSDDDKKNN